MKRSCWISTLPLLLLLPSSLMSGADLSTYRGFQFGMTLTSALKQSGMHASEVKSVRQRPALIEELIWNPTRFSARSQEMDAFGASRAAWLRVLSPRHLVLVSALDVKTGQVHGMTAGRHTSKEFVASLERLLAHTRWAKEIHIVLDNLSAHKTQDVGLATD